MHTCLLIRRAALEKWKQKSGADATYNNLIRVFELAGYQGYAEIVRNLHHGRFVKLALANLM